VDRPGGAFEPKLDGFRCLAFRAVAEVAPQLRQERPLGRYFPEVIAAVAELASGARGLGHSPPGGRDATSMLRPCVAWSDD
jgi:hypothetical protein